MADTADTIPAPEVHRLTGSSPPGSGPPEIKLLARSARRRALGQDAIARHANRVADLAREDNLACNALSDLQDRLMMEAPRRPLIKPYEQSEARPDKPSAELRDHLAQCTWSTEEQLAPLRARIAAMQAYERDYEAFRRGLGVDEQEMRCGCLIVRLTHQARALTTMRAASVLALGAKANAFLEVIAGGNRDDWVDDLAVSLARNAVQLGAQALCREVFDDRLLDLIAEHARARAACDEADEIVERRLEVFAEAKPPRPSRLYWSLHDPAPVPRLNVPAGDGKVFLVYGHEDIDRLREGLDPGYFVTCSDDPAQVWPQNERTIARRIDILDAWDAWQAECDALSERIGLMAASAEADRRDEVMDAAEKAIMAFVPQSQAGWAAKARWIVGRRATEEYRAELAPSLVQDLARLDEAGGALVDTSPDVEAERSAA